MKVKRLRKVVALALSAMLCIGAVGCAKDVSSSADAAKTEIVYASTKDIMDINPHLYTGEMAAQNMVFESLVTINNDGEIDPCLATSWEISKGGLEYTFKLREDVTFTDGEKFNADAVKQNFDAVLSNFDRHAWLELFNQIDKTEVVDEYTFKMTLKKAYYPSLTELALTRPFRMISPKCFIDGTTKNGVSDIVGTGSYVLSENHVDEYSIFKVNEDYWGEKPEIKEIEVKVIPDNQTRVMALKNGEVDLIYGTNMIDAETYKEFESLDGFKTSISDPISTRMMIINTTDEILGDVKVRKAIQHATDRKTISESIFSGIESPADTVLAKTVPYADIDLKAYDYNLDTAKKLLDEAGWKEVKGKTYRQKDGKELSIVLNYCSDSVTEKTIAEFYQSELAKVGIKLEISGEEEQAYRDRMKAGDFDITFNISWGSPYDPQSFLAGMRMPVYGDYAAQQGLKEKTQIDETILKALTSTDEEKRQEYYTYVLTTLHEEAVYIPLTYERNRAVYNEKVKNVTFNASQFEVPMEKMKIEE